MSQEKVDQNKKLKKNRKKIVKREKMTQRIISICSGIVALALVVWIGYSINGRVQDYHEANPNTEEVDLSELIQFSFDTEEE